MPDLGDSSSYNSSSKHIFLYVDRFYCIQDSISNSVFVNKTFSSKPFKNGSNTKSYI